jgi:O-antigen ligase
MAVLLVVMVGKVGNWAPGISGLPVLKIAFVIAVLYVSSVSGRYQPVRVGSLPLERLAMAFLILSVLSLVFSVYKSATLVSSYAAVIYLISFVMVLKTTQTQKDVERLLIALAVAGASLSVGVVLDFHGGRASLNGTYNANDLAYALVTLLPLVLALRGRGWGLRRLTVTTLGLVMCVAVLLTASRGGAVGLIVVLLAIAVFPLDLARNGELKRRNVGKVVVAVAFSALLGTVMFRYLPEETQERLLTLMHPEEDYNASTTLNSSRRVIWMRDLRLALERPIGYGMGTSVAVDGLYGHGQYRAPHNSVIEAFLEVGALGLYLYLACYFVAWRELGRISARQRDGPGDEGMKAALYARALRVALLGNFAAGFFLSQTYGAPLWMILAVSCVLIRITAADNGLTAVRQSPGRYSRWRRPRAKA